ncbi:hypothetical protein ONZ45_g10964 [Pleurotus djamor]|nr:hypothetical protein ONZ45_g10964 [Pleurotus djamor]
MTPANTTSTPPSNQLDVLIVGAGFAGVYQLYQFRKRGYNVKAVEAGDGLGGTWHWNRYPGARVDSDTPIYAYTMEDLWKGWEWKQRFPGWEELQSYFAYVDGKLDISRDVQFNTRVVSAHFNAQTDRWDVTTESGAKFYPRYLSLCVGALTSPFTPFIPGLDTFKGIKHHTARWPKEKVDVKGKRVGVLGTGASGVQVIQETASEVGHLTVFQRTPNFALPMVQRELEDEAERLKKEQLYPIIYKRRDQTFGGLEFTFNLQDLASVTPEERRLLFEELWAQGGFRIWLANYLGLYADQASNDIIYEFWRDKVRARINDPILQEKLAPTKAPHPFGVKRPSLESTYYEVYNQPNVTLVDLNENNIAEVTPKGIKMQDGTEHELDILVLATGFNAVTGAITDIDIRGIDGRRITDKWADGVKTYLGMTTENFPNMFWVYGPQGPTPLCNGPTCAEVQGSWIVECVEHMRANGLTRINAQTAPEEGYTGFVHQLAAGGLWSKANSWYMGVNIPGKKKEILFFTGGLPLYHDMCQDSAKNGYKGFTLTAVA